MRKRRRKYESEVMRMGADNAKELGWWAAKEMSVTTMTR